MVVGFNMLKKKEETYLYQQETQEHYFAGATLLVGRIKRHRPTSTSRNITSIQKSITINGLRIKPQTASQ